MNIFFRSTSYILVAFCLQILPPPHLLGDERVAVVGAGASGLSAAYTLKQLGYDDVVVFEKRNRVGGKVCTYPYRGKTYELGAYGLPASEVWLLNLAQKLDVPFRRGTGDVYVVDAAGRKSTFRRYMRRRYGPFQRLVGYWRWKRLKRTYPHYFTCGFVGADPRLYESMETFACRNRIRPITETLKPAVSGFGYGYFEEVPALYSLRLLDTLVNMRGALMGKTKDSVQFVKGFQSLWEAVAKELDVRTGQTVTSIDRFAAGASANGIRVRAAGADHVFDKVIISTLPKETLKFLDATPEEKRLFDQVRTYRLIVTLFHGSNLAHNEFLFLSRYARRATIGHVVALTNEHPDRDVWTAAQLASWDTNTAALKKKFRRDIEWMGGRVNSIITRTSWSYFPYVDSSSLRNGFYDAMAGIQGTNSTYFIGALLNFESVWNTSQYARRLVHIHFR